MNIDEIVGIRIHIITAERKEGKEERRRGEGTERRREGRKKDDSEEWNGKYL